MISPPMQNTSSAQCRVTARLTASEGASAKSWFNSAAGAKNANTTLAVAIPVITRMGLI
jgi:hypothetical protein